MPSPVPVKAQSQKLRIVLLSAERCEQGIGGAPSLGGIGREPRQSSQAEPGGWWETVLCKWVNHAELQKVSREWQGRNQGLRRVLAITASVWAARCRQRSQGTKSFGERSSDLCPLRPLGAGLAIYGRSTHTLGWWFSSWTVLQNHLEGLMKPRWPVPTAEFLSQVSGGTGNVHL